MLLHGEIISPNSKYHTNMAKWLRHWFLWTIHEQCVSAMGMVFSKIQFQRIMLLYVSNHYENSDYGCICFSCFSNIINCSRDVFIDYDLLYQNACLQQGHNFLTSNLRQSYFCMFQSFWKLGLWITLFSCLSSLISFCGNVFVTMCYIRMRVCNRNRIFQNWIVDSHVFVCFQSFSKLGLWIKLCFVFVRSQKCSRDVIGTICYLRMYVSATGTVFSKKELSIGMLLYVSNRFGDSGCG